LLGGFGMHDTADRVYDGAVTADDAPDREFEDRLLETSTLAFRVAYSVLRHREDAEDVAQEAFVRAHRGFRQLRDRTRFRAWLVRTTWRLALDRRRGDRRRTSRELVPLPSARVPSGEDEVIANERAGRLWQAIDELPDKLRVVVVLAAMEGHDVREVAELLGLPDGTVKSRLFLARERLRERLR
jgi:RNA polymerase sigma-70 factor, ECF subfamily